MVFFFFFFSPVSARDNFCNFPFASLQVKPILEMGLLYKEGASFDAWSRFSSFSVDPFSESAKIIKLSMSKGINSIYEDLQFSYHLRKC